MEPFFEGGVDDEMIGEKIKINFSQGGGTRGVLC